MGNLGLNKLGSVSMCLANGMSKAEIIEDFEEISKEMIDACLAFAAEKDPKLILSI